MGSGELNGGRGVYQVYEAAVGDGRHRVFLHAVCTGDGAVVTLVGGEHAHVGAVALGLPRPSLRDARTPSADVAVVPVPGHKDDRVARPVAEAIARVLGQPVVVSVGLHVDQATDEDLARLVENARTAAYQFLASIPR
ncbi:MAG: hypothetical protein QMC81_06905 [Thermoanaerobacterales bacterium]|nr:hypothetical protein [Bacillota bacterium]MDI6907196.1 hypothetical protein [Thermoanaerobacterales bacterium]